MKKILIIAVLQLTMVMIAQDVIEITTGEYPPYMGKDLPHQGSVAHVIREAFKQEDISVSFKFYPWKRAYEMAKSGDFIATAFWFLTDERAQDFYYSKHPVNIDDFSFFYMKNSPMKPWNTVADLKDYTIGITRGYTYSSEFMDMMANQELNTEPVSEDLQNLNKLLLGRIDITPIGTIPGMLLIRQNFSPDEQKLFLIHPKPLKEDFSYLLFSRSHPDAKKWMDIFDQGMEKLKQSGIIDKINSDLQSGKYETK